MSVRVIGPRPTVDSARLLLGVVLEYMDRERELREGDNVVRGKLLVRSETLPPFQYFGGVLYSHTPERCRVESTRQQALRRKQTLCCTFTACRCVPNVYRRVLSEVVPCGGVRMRGHTALVVCFNCGRCVVS